MISLNAHFDGKVLVPDEPLELPANQKVRIQIEAIASNDSTEPTESAPESKLALGLQQDAFPYVAPDFDEPLSDEFWLGVEK